MSDYVLKQCKYQCYPMATSHIGEECQRCKNSCNHIMVDTGKYERECKFCKLSELRANGTQP